MQDILEGRVASLVEIAAREDKVERHIRLLAPLGFVSPKIVSGASLTAPTNMTVGRAPAFMVSAGRACISGSALIEWRRWFFAMRRARKTMAKTT